MINVKCGQPIFIGKQGENDVTEIAFPIPPEYADWSYTVYVKRHRDASSYPAANIARQDGQIVWTVSDADTDKAGPGEVQIRFTSGTDRAKTFIYQFVVSKSIDMNPGEQPNVYETWLDALTELAETTHTNAENAAESEQNAKTSEDNAKASEEAAQQSEQRALESEQAAGESAEDAEAWAVGKRKGADVSQDDITFLNNSKFFAEVARQAASENGWVYLYIDDDGYLHYVKTPNANLDFYIDNDGYLHVRKGA